MSTYTRRAVLLAGVGTAALLGTAGVLRRHNHGAHPGVPDVAHADPQDVELRRRASADELLLAQESLALIKLLHPGNPVDDQAKALLATIQTHHGDHAKFLTSSAKALPRAMAAALIADPGQLVGRDPVPSLEPSPFSSPTTSPQPTSTPTPTPSPTPTHTPSPRPSPPPSASPIPSRTFQAPPAPSPSPTLSRSVRASLRSLAQAERRAQGRRRVDCLSAGADLARVLASLGAANAIHLDLLNTLAAS